MKTNLSYLEEKYPNVKWQEPGWYEAGNGWVPIIEKLVEELSNLPTSADVNILQIKEKFGELRVSVSVDNSVRARTNDLISKTEQNSRRICEMCGSPGKLRDTFSDGTERSWIKTLCDACNTPKRMV